MKDNKIYLMLLSIMLYAPFIHGITVVLDTNQIIHSFNQQMRVLDDYFDSVREEMHTMFESMNKAWQTFEQEQEKKATAATLSFDIEDKSDTNHVVIEIKGVNMDPSAEIQAKVEFDDDENPVVLLIDFADQIIRLDYTQQYRFLSVEMKHETREEQKKDQQVAQVVQVGIARHGKTLREDIQLDQSQVTYNKKEEILTVTIPKVTKKKTEKIIPINIK
ncbi:MAG TPA: hypothetical protein ENI08_01405 [Candidatus Dependentiae bacterium]|nr:hypothetical protein [Candidatus Dependentiae bacterium]